MAVFIATIFSGVFSCEENKRKDLIFFERIKIREQMSRVIVFEGKKYPRYFGEDRIGLTEAMARLRAKTYKIRHSDQYGCQMTLFVNLTDAPEGVQEFGIYCQDLSTITEKIYTVDKRAVDSYLRELRLPSSDDETTLVLEKKVADLRLALEKKVADLERAADAATFALESSADSDPAGKEMRAHWAQQEHEYLVARAALLKASK